MRWESKRTHSRRKGGGRAIDSFTSRRMPVLRHVSSARTASTIPPVALHVLPLPRLPSSGRRLGEAMPLAETTGFLAGGGETPGFAVLVSRLAMKTSMDAWRIEPPYLVHGVDDPVDPRVATDGLVLRIDQDDLKVLVRRVLVDPV